MLPNLKRKLHKIKMVRDVYFFIKFILNNKYIPNFNNPCSYNEKINKRKRQPKNEFFSICSDKIKAKEYVRDIIRDDITIENYFVGDYVSLNIVKDILKNKGKCFIKANHNSGPVFYLSPDKSDHEIETICININKQLNIDFGKINNEPWYSQIKPRVLIEKKLSPIKGESDIRDYKFHVFKQLDGTFKILVHIDFDRSNFHSRSYFNEDLEWVPIGQYAPIIHTNIDKPKNYDKMLDIVKMLAKPFSYVRVDLYNVNGEIYFGELTFAPGSGEDPFNHKDYDYWLGKLWVEDPQF